MASELINILPVEIQIQQFESAELNAATEQIARIFYNASKYAEEKNREIASILARVDEGKHYERDGFKNIADYANKTFGLARQNAYALTRAGKMYNDESAPDSLKQFTPHKYAAIAAVNPEEVLSDIAEGKITSQTSLAELKKYASEKAAASNGEQKADVLDRYTARPCLAVVPELLAGGIKESRIIDDWDEYFINSIAAMTGSDVESVEVVVLKKGKINPDAKKSSVNRRLYFNRYFSVVVEFYTYTESKQAMTEQQYTVEQLEAMLEAARQNQQ